MVHFKLQLYYLRIPKTSGHITFLVNSPRTVMIGPKQNASRVEKKELYFGCAKLFLY